MNIFCGFIQAFFLLPQITTLSRFNNQNGAQFSILTSSDILTPVAVAVTRTATISATPMTFIHLKDTGIFAVSQRDGVSALSS